MIERQESEMIALDLRNQKQRMQNLRNQTDQRNTERRLRPKAARHHEEYREEYREAANTSYDDE